ncbi:MAG: hypothetical protein K9N55_18935 [Phycisphaerae bacterium]|nr:hypothetical protein [Phycisphaerae bacterium]
MFSVNRYFVIFILGASLGLAGPGLAQMGEVFAVWPSEGDQEAPAIHGNRIVWHEFMPEFGDFDIVVADINDLDAIEGQIIGEDGDQMNPDVWEDTVVWQSFQTESDESAHWDVWAARMPHMDSYNLFNISRVLDNDEQMPRISGNTVVWEDGPLESTSIYGSDITDVNRPVEFAIANYASKQSAPAIDRLTVVWQDNEFGDWDIYGSDIWLRNRPEEYSVTPFEAHQTAPAISGKYIVWQDQNAGNWDIYAARMDGPCLVHLPPVTDDVSDQVNPAIDGQIVVWQDGRHGDWEIYAAHLRTGKQFRITRNPANQIRPAVYGRVIVWQDDRSGVWQVYAMILEDGPLTQSAEACSEATVLD